MKGPTSVPQLGLLGLLGIKSNGEQFKSFADDVVMTMDFARFVYAQTPQYLYEDGSLVGSTTAPVLVDFGAVPVPERTLRVLLNCSVIFETSGGGYATAQYSYYPDATHAPGVLNVPIPIHPVNRWSVQYGLSSVPSSTVVFGACLQRDPVLIRPGGYVVANIFDVVVGLGQTIDYRALVDYIDVPL